MLTAYTTKFLLPAAVIVGLVAVGHQRYTAGYEAGILAERTLQERKAYEARTTNERAKEKLEAAHETELARLRDDNRRAGDAADRLHRELSTIRRLAVEHTGPVPGSTSTRDTVVLLTDVLRESVERSRQLAAYADRARASGELCREQYESLRD